MPFSVKTQVKVSTTGKLRKRLNVTMKHATHAATKTMPTSNANSKPDTPALLPLDVEQRATRACVGVHGEGLPIFTFVNTAGMVSTVVPVVIYALHAGVPLHTFLHRAGTPQYHPMAPFQAPLPEGLPGNGCRRRRASAAVLRPNDLRRREGARS